MPFPRDDGDCVRWHAKGMRGKEVLFVTETDEHGEKIAMAVQARGLPPRERRDDMVVIYKQLWQQVAILCVSSLWAGLVVIVDRADVEVRLFLAQ